LDIVASSYKYKSAKSSETATVFIHWFWARYEPVIQKPKPPNILFPVPSSSLLTRKKLLKPRPQAGGLFHSTVVTRFLLNWVRKYCFP